MGARMNEQGKTSPVVLGLKIVSHDTGAALIANGRVVAIAEERLNRKKHSFNMFPTLSIAYVLKECGLQASDVDLVVIDQVHHKRETDMVALFKKNTKEEFAHAEIKVINHHDAHAATAFLCSPFEESAVLVYDGSGEKFVDHSGCVSVETETLYRGFGNSLQQLQKTTHQRKGNRFVYTFGIGKLYSFLSSYYLNFGAYNEGKMMGLAPYGDLSLLNTFPEERWWKEVNGHMVCNALFSVPSSFSFPGHALLRDVRDSLRGFLLRALLSLAGFVGAVQYENPHLFSPIRLLKPRRSRDTKLPDQYYASVARAGQEILEKVAVAWGLRLRAMTGSDNLVIAGGVGLNIDANRNFLEKVGFKNIFVQPASSDSGIGLGCALYGFHILRKQPRFYEMKHAYLGRTYSEKEVVDALKKFEGKIVYRKSSSVARDSAKLLSEGKILGWFEGGSEYGPRALGHRSIVADPRKPDMKDVLNFRVKHREGWRPFATSMLKEKLSEYFELEHESPYMLLAAKGRAGVAEKYPSVIHVDNTSRIQTVTKEANGRYWELINEFYLLTGSPIILNTSFNLGGDPIVETPWDALDTFTRTDMDYLVLEEYIVEMKK